MRIVSVVVGVMLAVLAGALIWVVSGDDGERRLGVIRSYSTGKTLLLSEGRQLGVLRSAECGVLGAEATRVDAGKSGPDAKQIGGPQWQPCELTFGISMNSELYDWINAALAGKAAPKPLTLQTLDSDNKDRGRLDLSQAVLTEFSMPAFDASNPDVASMTIKVQAQSMRTGGGSGTVVSTAGIPTAKSWNTASFKFELAGQDTPVPKISSFRFTIPPGTQRPLLDNITVTASESALGSLPKLLDSFVLGGRNTPEYEMNAKVTMLNSTGATTLGTLDLTGVGIVGGDMVPTLESSGDTIAKRHYTLYAEGATLTIAP